jgi:hypothetical protein
MKQYVRERLGWVFTGFGFVVASPGLLIMCVGTALSARGPFLKNLRDEVFGPGLL